MNRSGIYGIGFAPSSGGPLAWMDRRGVANVVAKLDELKGIKVERANLGPCPHCGKDVIENRKGAVSMKGTGFDAIGPDLLYLAAFSFVGMTLAVRLFRRTL